MQVRLLRPSLQLAPPVGTNLLRQQQVQVSHIILSVSQILGPMVMSSAIADGLGTSPDQNNFSYLKSVDKEVDITDGWKFFLCTRLEAN